jgi:hypothetical protein
MERLVETMKEKEGKWNNNRKIAYHVLDGSKRKIQIRKLCKKYRKLIVQGDHHCYKIIVLKKNLFVHAI